MAEPRDVVVADEMQWRQVKNANGGYVHRPEAHAYPGADNWDEDSCAAGKHSLCELQIQEWVRKVTG